MTVAWATATCDISRMRVPVLAVSIMLAGCVAPTVAPAPAPPVRAIIPAGNPAIGGVTIPLDQSIAADLVRAPTLSGLVRALDAAGMADTLRSGGPFTVFAPSDAAFGRLQPGTVEALMKPENRASLTRLLGLHVVPERLGAMELMRRITAGGGSATLTTVAGEPLTMTLTSGIVTLTDTGGNKSYVETADVRAANGIIHVVNGVLVPRLN